MATRVDSRCSEEFEPFCKWEKDECSQILELHLPGFKKEQMKVAINNCTSTLTITGERPLQKCTWSHFRKEFKLSDDIKTNEIKAKFSCGVLTITMPKTPPQVHEPCQCSGRLADDEGTLSCKDFGVKVVSITPDEKCVMKCMAVGGVLAVVMVVLSAAVYGAQKYYELHCHM